jgi:hypothetical protein
MEYLPTDSLVERWLSSQQASTSAPGDLRGRHESSTSSSTDAGRKSSSVIAALEPLLLVPSVDVSGEVGHVVTG